MIPLASRIEIGRMAGVGLVTISARGKASARAGLGAYLIIDFVIREKAMGSIDIL
jgi:hypothetical protein